MRPFVLGTVLSLREQAEKAEERATVAAFREVQSARAVSTALLAMMNERSSSRAAQLDQVFTAAHHNTAAMDWKAMETHRIELEKHIHELEQRAKKQQLRYLAARTDREVLTELYEKYEKVRADALQKSERKMLEDLFLSRMIRGS